MGIPSCQHAAKLAETSTFFQFDLTYTGKYQHQPVWLAPGLEALQYCDIDMSCTVLIQYCDTMQIDYSNMSQTLSKSKLL